VIRSWGESTRCRDIEGGGASMVATRARWRVDSNSNSSENRLDMEEVCERAGESGRMVLGGTRTGKVVVFVGDGEVSHSGDDDGGGGGAFIPVVRPWAASALTTASQPFSRDLIRSLSSSFSFSQAFFSSSLGASNAKANGRWWGSTTTPARNCLFSSSSSVTLRSR
jgi:hypothetical protein